jgi:hypothetical protein
VPDTTCGGIYPNYFLVSLLVDLDGRDCLLHSACARLRLCSLGFEVSSVSGALMLLSLSGRGRVGVVNLRLVGLAQLSAGDAAALAAALRAQAPRLRLLSLRGCRLGDAAGCALLQGLRGHGALTAEEAAIRESASSFAKEHLSPAAVLTMDTAARIDPSLVQALHAGGFQVVIALILSSYARCMTTDPGSVPVGSVVITKLDGHAKGGGALSAASVAAVAGASPGTGTGFMRPCTP